jgi:tRNA(fMet)-specific endonuclease VapC
MGLILDTSILIANERRGKAAEQLLQRLVNTFDETEAAISAISVVELTHGIYRAKINRDRERRAAYCNELYRDLMVDPVSLAIAELAGRIEEEQAPSATSSTLKISLSVAQHCTSASMSRLLT